MQTQKRTAGTDLWFVTNWFETKLDEIEETYMRGTSETEEDHLERLRRKNKRKAWRRLRVRERELARLTGKIVSTRREEDDDYYFDAEQQRREWSQQARR